MKNKKKMKSKNPTPGKVPVKPAGPPAKSSAPKKAVPAMPPMKKGGQKKGM